MSISKERRDAIRYWGGVGVSEAEILALLDALDAAEAEPVAWRWPEPNTGGFYVVVGHKPLENLDDWQPLYAHPAPAEPVAWEGYWPGAGSADSYTKLTRHKSTADDWVSDGADVTPLYAHPAPAEPVAVKLLEWSQSKVFGRQKRRGFGAFGEFCSFDAEDLSQEEISAKEAVYQADYETRIRSALTRPAPAVREGWKPTHWALYSASGSHIGLWQDETWVERLQAQYPGSTILPLATAPEAK